MRRAIAVALVVAVVVFVWAFWFLSRGDVAKADEASEYKRRWKVVEVRRYGVAHTPLVFHRGEWCRSETVEARGMNMLGGTVASVFSRTSWCSNGRRYTSYDRDHWLDFHGGALNPWYVDTKFDPVTTNGCCVGSPGYSWRKNRYEFLIKAACVFDICLSRSFGTTQTTAYQTRSFYREDVFG